MNTDRLLREMERRLVAFPENLRGEALAAVREEIARERKHDEPGRTVETERERRMEAETLREVVETIHRASGLDGIIEEALRQLDRLVAFECCWLTLVDPDGRLRVVAARGAAGHVVGARFRDPLTDMIRERLFPLALADVEAEERFVAWPGSPRVRSWWAMPLVVEGELLGLLGMGRTSVEPFSEDDQHRTKALVFSAAAAIRQAKAVEQVKRYAALMEQVVSVDHVVFTGASLGTIAHAILEGASRIGNYHGGLFVLQGPAGPRVGAALGDVFLGTVGKPAPADLAAASTRRLPLARLRECADALEVSAPAGEAYLVPVATPEQHVGTLVLIDPNGETPDDRLMEAFASRAATAYRHAATRA